MNGDNVTYFDSFGAEFNAKKILKLIGNKNIITNIYKIQANNSVMCGYFCIGYKNGQTNSNNSPAAATKLLWIDCH